MSSQRIPWTRADLLIAFGLYCRTPFGKMHKSNPEIIKLAGIIGRTPSSLAMKLSNFASLDPDITSTGRSGLQGASVADKAIWREFHADWEGLAAESNAALAKQMKSEAAAAKLLALDEISDTPNYEGVTKRVLTGVRQKQSFFRKMVLSSYESQCCMSGVTETKLLIASHIVPWSEDKSNRLNPRNGLCLSALHDRAFDQGLITVGLDFRVKVSKRLKKQQENAHVADSLLALADSPIRMPEKFRPEPEFLKWHQVNRFERNQ